MAEIQFKGEEVFTLANPENYTGLYFPIASENGIKSAVTPNLGGDAKYDHNSFLLEPVSEANLHNNRGVRNVWFHVEGKGIWSAVGASAEQESMKFSKNQEKSEIEAGFMWQTVTRESEKYALRSEVTSFVPVENDVELMYVTVSNTGNDILLVTPTVAVPIYGRSADNMRDHRHVTAMLHRVTTNEYGVMVKPTLSFDERGHKKNNLTYFVCGTTGNGEKPADFYPLVNDFIGEGGTLTMPYMVAKNEPGVPAGSRAEGKEAFGGLHFSTMSLLPGEKISIIVVMGITKDADKIPSLVEAYDSDEKVLVAKERLTKYWTEKVNVYTNTGNVEKDGLMRWISFQPFLRRAYGCSFLPHHDYGRGGRGWRDLWQDCLSLLIMDPKDVRGMIVDNYGGVRIDGTNATIIGAKQGEFIADRNGIARVWMDHGLWPFITTKLYINQTGDVDVLKEMVGYFKDEQCMRGTDLDEAWNSEQGVVLRQENGEVYKGTVLEHIILENLCGFYEVGEHNHMRLRGADWNDALDMAAERGESVAFTAAYAGNLLQIAELMEILVAQYGWNEILVLEEMNLLLNNGNVNYDDIDSKKAVLNTYLEACKHNVSGKKQPVSLLELAKDLKEKSNWIMEHIRNTEWIQGDQEGWFNSYYDNDGNAVEGYREDHVRMMLTGQVFTIMSGTAKEEQVAQICKSADKYLYKKGIGGYRLNTNFHEEKYNMGRMFGFAYGEKENGAVFSHMTVMYANALYQRGFVKEGYKALSTLAEHALDFRTSKIYPGIPEYFDANGRGLYHYLTGAASWFLLTYVTEVFGIKGDMGNLIICPKLVKEQFSKEGLAGIKLTFRGKTFVVNVSNKGGLDYGSYKIAEATCDDVSMTVTENATVLEESRLSGLDEGEHVINVVLEKK